MKPPLALYFLLVWFLAGCIQDNPTATDETNQIDISVGGNELSRVRIVEGETGPTSVKVAANWISLSGEDAIEEYGFVLSESTDPQPGRDSTFTWQEDPSATVGTGDFSHRFQDLAPSTDYWVRAIAKRTGASSFQLGEAINFRTTGYPPQVQTGDPTFIDSDRATVRGKVLGIGSSDVLEYGHVWSTDSRPTINSADKTIFSGPIGANTEYESDLSNLQDGVDYYYRAYAINGDGTMYGEVKSLSTEALPYLYVDSVEIINESVALDGKINRGEEITLRFYVENAGTEGATGVRMEVSSNQSNWIVDGPTPAFRDMGAFSGSSTVAKTAEFTLTVDDFAPWDSTVVLDLRFTDDQNEVWIDTHEFVIESQYAVTNGLILYYTFDRDDQLQYDVKDELGQYDGETYFDPIYDALDRPNASGYSIDFGTTSADIPYIKLIQNPLDSLTEATFNLWVKTTGYGYSIFSEEATVPFGQNPDSWAYAARIQIEQGHIEIATGHNINWPTNRLIDGNWHMLTISIQDGEQKLYLDGDLKEIASYSRESISRTVYVNPSFTIGARRYSNATYTRFPYDGKLDNFRIYDRVLTSDEIYELYQTRQ